MFSWKEEGTSGESLQQLLNLLKQVENVLTLQGAAELKMRLELRALSDGSDAII